MTKSYMIMEDGKVLLSAVSDTEIGAMRLGLQNVFGVSPLAELTDEEVQSNWKIKSKDHTKSMKVVESDLEIRDMTK